MQHTFIVPSPMVKPLTLSSCCELGLDSAVASRSGCMGTHRQYYANTFQGLQDIRGAFHSTFGDSSIMICKVFGVLDHAYSMPTFLYVDHVAPPSGASCSGPFTVSMFVEAKELGNSTAVSGVMLQVLSVQDNRSSDTLVWLRARACPSIDGQPQARRPVLASVRTWGKAQSTRTQIHFAGMVINALYLWIIIVTYGIGIKRPFTRHNFVHEYTSLLLNYFQTLHDTLTIF